MPPEQVLDCRTVKPAGDQYAAAATLYHLLTAAPLYDGITSLTDAYKKILQENPVPITRRRADIPAPLPEAIHWALARPPDQRFASVEEFRQALARTQAI